MVELAQNMFGGCCCWLGHRKKSSYYLTHLPANRAGMLIYGDVNLWDVNLWDVNLCDVNLWGC